MELLYKIWLATHVLAGIITLIAGPVAIFHNFKNIKQHRLAGKVFFYSMLIVCISSFSGFITKPNVVFYQFLLGITFLVLVNIGRGVRAIFIMKGDRVRPFDTLLSAVIFIAGAIMLQRGIHFFTTSKNLAFPILFSVFGASAISDGIKHYRLYAKAAGMHALDWMHIHLNSMLGAFIASSTAFTVNVGGALPWYLQWFGPTLLLVPINIYFGRKLRKMKSKASAKSGVKSEQTAQLQSELV